MFFFVINAFDLIENFWRKISLLFLSVLVERTNNNKWMIWSSNNYILIAEKYFVFLTKMKTDWISVSDEFIEGIDTITV